MAHLSQWCFVVARTENGSKRHPGLSYLLVPLDQAGVEVRPIEQLTGDSEFNEVFFDDARTDADLVVGEPGDGWRVAMGTLAFERGVSTLGQQIGYARELSDLVELAKSNGAADDPLIRDRLTRSWVGPAHHAVVRAGDHGRRAAGAGQRVQAGLGQLARDLGELAMEVAGPAGLRWPRRRARRVAAPLPVLPRRHDLRRLDEIQRNILAERVLGLPERSKADERSRECAPNEIEGHGLLAGKVVVVTAAAGTGIGAAVVRRALEEGADVVVSDPHERRLGEARDQLAEFGLGRVESVVCDVTSTAQVDALISSTTARMGRLDVMVNNAGLGGRRPSST